MLAGKMGRELTLKRALKPLQASDYDVILLDCPPTLGLLTVNALVAADHALLTDRGAVLRDAGRRAGARGHRARARRPEPRPRAGSASCSTSPTCARATAARRTPRCSEHFGEQALRRRRSARRSPTPRRPSARVSILDHRPDLGADYLALADEILERLKMPDARARLKALAAALAAMMRRVALAVAACVAVALAAAGGVPARCATATAAATRRAPSVRAPQAARRRRRRSARRRARRWPLGAQLVRRVQLRERPGGRVVRALRPAHRLRLRPRARRRRARGRAGSACCRSYMPNSRAGWIPADAARAALRALHARRRPLRARGSSCAATGASCGASRSRSAGPATTTPTGRFAVTDPLRVSGAGRPYGCCALALTGRQPNVPQGWTGGDRLAIHGTTERGARSATRARARAAACARASARHALADAARSPLGAPACAIRRVALTSRRLSGAPTARARRRPAARTARAGRRPSPRPRGAARPTTAPVASACVQNRTVGPAPEIVAPIAPNSRARSSSAIDRGNRCAR